MTTVIAGIDPGVSGAIAVVAYEDANHYVITTLEDLPTSAGPKGKVTDVCTLRYHLLCCKPAVVVVEYPMWAKHDGAVQSSTAWQNFGRVAATIELCCNEYVEQFIQVSPVTWKADMGLTLGHLADRKQKKAHSLAVARKLFGTEPYLKRVKDHDRGEALLLTYWGFSHAT